MLIYISKERTNEVAEAITVGMHAADQLNEVRVERLLNHTAEANGHGAILSDGIQSGHSLVDIAKSERGSGWCSSFCHTYIIVQFRIGDG